MTCGLFELLVTVGAHARPLRHGPSADRTPRDLLRARENQGDRATCDAGCRELLSWDVGRPPRSAV
jgi:hypothetical protein